MTGLFITFEGGDGVGKSTHVRRLGEHFEKLGHEVVRTREPGGTPLGVELRRVVLHTEAEIVPKAEALVYAADRANHIATKVRPALERGATVLQDRYIDSSIAYQGSGRDLGADEIRELSLWATGGLLPDLTILLDLDPSSGRQRLKTGRDALDRLESESRDFHEKVRETFLALAAKAPERYLVLDASQPEGVVARAILARVDELLVARA